MPGFINFDPQGFADRIPSKIKDFFFKKSSKVGIQDPEDGELSNKTVTTDNDDAATAIFKIFNRDRTEYDRYKTGTVSWLCYNADSRVKSGVKGFAYEATASDNEGQPFRLTTSIKEPNVRQKRVFNKIKQKAIDLKLTTKAYAIAKRMFIEGDAFYEVIINFTTNEVVCLEELPGIKEGFITRVMIDKKDKKLLGYAHYDMSRGEKLVRIFAPWQICQFSLDKEGYYGNGGLGSAIIDQERLAKSEKSMHIAREERAFVKVNHINKNATTSQLAKIRKEYQDEQRKRETGVATDYFSTEPMQFFDPQNEQLKNIEDINYFESKLLTAIGRPKGLYGGYSDVANRSVLDAQIGVYNQMLSKVNETIGIEYKKILDYQLILWKQLPSEYNLGLKWVEKVAGEFLNLVRGLVLAVQSLGLATDTALEELGFDPEVEREKRKLNAEDLAMKAKKMNSADAGNKKSSKQKNYKNGTSNPNSKETADFELINRLIS